MFHTRSLFLTLIALTFMLAGCESPSYYNNSRLPQWDFNAPQSQPAQASPNDLTETTYTPETTALNRAAPAPQANTKVAILLPLTGQHADMGNAMLNAAQIALFDIGHDNFELMPYDTQGTETGARNAAQQAAQNNAQLVLGPVFAGNVRAAKNVLKYRNINMIAFSTDWSITDQQTFTMGFLPFDQIERITTYAAANNLTNIGIIAPKTTYGRAIIAAYQSVAAQTNINTIDTLTYSPGAKSLSPDIRRFSRYDQRTESAKKQARAQRQAEGKSIDDQAIASAAERIKAEMPPPYDAILIAAGGQDAITISNLLSHYDLNPRIVRRLGTGLFDDPALAGEVGLRDSWFAAPSMQTRQDFNTRYISLYGQEAPRLATLAYDATALSAVLARRGLQTTGAPAFDRRSITNPNGFSGIDGIFRFLDNGTAERGLSIATFKNGTIQQIEPAQNTFQK